MDRAINVSEPSASIFAVLASTKLDGITSQRTGIILMLVNTLTTSAYWFQIHFFLSSAHPYHYTSCSTFKYPCFSMLEDSSVNLPLCQPQSPLFSQSATKSLLQNSEYPVSSTQFQSSLGQKPCTF
jgi:hypothetical protein